MIASDLSPAVFVVDDDASVRDGIRTLLRSVGLQAEVFSSAEEFLNAKRPEAPSCLVLDVRLPGVSGLDFQDRLSSAGIEIPIIFITAHSDIPTSLRALKGGGDRIPGQAVSDGSASDGHISGPGRRP
jgi:FixJ family two-component response regulator